MTEVFCRTNYKEGYDHFKEFLEQLQNKADIALFKQMKTIMNGYFGEANNQIIIRPSYEVLGHIFDDYHMELALRDVEDMEEWAEANRIFAFSIIVHFPEVEITNSRGNTHTIRDLYVKVFMNERGVFDRSILGARTTFASDEFQSHYVHSHLNSRSEKGEFTPFCLGDGQIGQVLTNLNDNFSIDDFHLFCIHLKNYVAWESLEGSPYKEFNDIRLAADETRLSTRLPSIRVKSYDIGTLLLKILVTLSIDRFMELFEIDLTSTKVIVSPTDNLREFSAVLIMNHWDEWHRVTSTINIGDVVNTRDENGLYRTTFTQRPIVLEYNTNKTILTFKGEKRQLKIINNEQEKQEEEQSAIKKYAHPWIIKYICDYFTEQFTEEAIAAKETDVGNYTTQNRQESTGTDFEVGTTDQRQGMVGDALLQDSRTLRLEELQDIR